MTGELGDLKILFKVLELGISSTKNRASQGYYRKVSRRNLKNWGKSLPNHLKRRKTRFYWRTIDSEENQQKLAKVQEIYNKLKKASTKFDKAFKYVINMDNTDEKILFTNDAKFIRNKQLKLHTPSEVVDLNLEKFLTYSVPKSLELFCFN